MRLRLFGVALAVLIGRRRRHKDSCYLSRRPFQDIRSTAFRRRSLSRSLASACRCPPTAIEFANRHARNSRLRRLVENGQGGKQ